MSQDNNVEYEQLPDYAVVYADNVILQLGRDTPKLIFYQQPTKVNDLGTGIEKNKQIKRLKFEVRLSNRALQRLSAMALAMMQERKNALKSTEGQSDDMTANAWWQFDKSMESVYYDTDDYYLKPDDLSKLLQQANNLAQELQASIQRQKQNPKQNQNGFDQ